MKTILALAFVTLGMSARAGILAGPVVNPANGHCYYLLSQNTWSNAQAEAVSLGGHLATIRNAHEDRWVYSTFSGYGGALWIGLTDRQQVFQFTWVSGEPVSYTNWSGGQPDNGTGGIEFYAHIWPQGHTHSGQWNDYAAGVDAVLGVPLFGVAEISPSATVRLSLSTPSNTNDSRAFADSTAVAATGPHLHAFMAIELTWASEKDKVYQVQWTLLMEQPHWENIGPPMSGTGTVLSIFDLTRQRPQTFYRVQVVQ
jgi:hypothetical protein